MRWFRLHAEFAFDNKVQMMPENYQRRLIMLMCLRCNVTETFHVTGETVTSTLHETFSDEMIAFELRISLDEWLVTKSVFIEKGFVDESNRLLNWEKRQYLSDSSTARVRKHREAKKIASMEGRKTDNGSVTRMKRFSNVPVTPPDNRLQIQNYIKDKTKVLSKKTKSWDARKKDLAAFKVTDDLRTWCKQKGYANPDAHVDEFKDYYLALTNCKYSDWTRTFRNWMRKTVSTRKPQNQDAMFLAGF